MEKITIAIDGPSGAGKSTIAKELANKLKVSYIDTGAMYRGIAYAAKNSNIDEEDNHSLKKMLSTLKLGFSEDGHIEVNDKIVENNIRNEEISKLASRLSQKDFIREYLVRKQKEIGKTRNVVMEGRDIGTVVLPEAKVKFYLTASEEIRAKRRWDQLQEKGNKTSYDQVLKDIRQRDWNDMNRSHSPLRKSDDAIVFDNSTMTLEETVEEMERMIRSKL